MNDFLHTVMAQAVEQALNHVEAGGIPFVGLVVEGERVISGFGVNTVQETGDPTAHAEIVAMRDALSATGRPDLSGTILLATGEPCGMCYHHATTHGIADIRVAVDRDTVARLGFDYRASYLTFGITDERRASLFRLLRVPGDTVPFTRFLDRHINRN